jgi:uncharacterized protein YegL
VWLPVSRRIESAENLLSKPADRGDLTMRRIVLPLLLPLAVLAATAALPRAAGFAQPSNVSPCTLVVDKVAAPAVLPLGYATTLTLTAKPSCPGVVSPTLHIVLVLDASGSMAGQPHHNMIEGSRRFVRALDLPRNAWIEVGVVEFSGSAQRLCALTNDESRVRRCIDAVNVSGGSAVDAGILEGLQVLRQGRGTGVPPREVLIVFSDGGNNAGCDPVLAACRQARGQDILVVAMCVGSGCDQQCMRSCASSPRYYFQADDAGSIDSAFNYVLSQIMGLAVRRLVVLDLLPPNMVYVAGSADPPPDPPGTQNPLAWTFGAVGADGVTITLLVRPTELGDHPTNVDAGAELLDSEGRSASAVFPVPTVRVIGPAGFPTPTPYMTRTPALTPTPPPTNTPSPTATSAGPVPPAPLACTSALARVPRAAIDAALANPAAFGLGQPCNPGRPEGPTNPPKTSLGLRNPGVAYHPLANPLVFKCGCP